MPRRPRIDKPGRLHHVMSRGQDRRRIFHGRPDYRFFLSLLVRAMRAGRIRIHAYSLMPNHFHLLVESLDGRLSATMHWVLFQYAAYYNRTHVHAGHVFGQRFLSFPVLSSVYLLVLIRYIDRNRWKAKKKIHPLQFLWGSAFHHARSGPRPRWLDRRIISRFLRTRLNHGEERVEAYCTVFGIARLDPAADELVESRMAGRSRGRDPLDALVLASPEELARWLRARVGDADEPSAPLALLDPGSILRALERMDGEAASLRLETHRGRTRDPRLLMAVGLLRDVVGVTYEAAARMLGASQTRLRARYTQHIEALEQDRYVLLLARILHAALERAYGDEARRAARDGVGSPWLASESAEHG